LPHHQRCTLMKTAYSFDLAHLLFSHEITGDACASPESCSANDRYRSVYYLHADMLLRLRHLSQFCFLWVYLSRHIFCTSNSWLGTDLSCLNASQIALHHICVRKSAAHLNYLLHYLALLQCPNLCSCIRIGSDYFCRPGLLLVAGNLELFDSFLYSFYIFSRLAM